MTKKEFLNKLEESLNSYLPTDQVIEQINYYEDYISNEIKNGKNENTVLDELGDPTLIAKTIKQVNNNIDNNDANSYNNTNSNDNIENNYQNDNSNTTNKKRYTRIYDPTGLGCSLATIFFFIFLVFILRIMGFLVSGVFFFISPFSLVILLMLIFSIFRNRR